MSLFRYALLCLSEPVVWGFGVVSEEKLYYVSDIRVQVYSPQCGRVLPSVGVSLCDCLWMDMCLQLFIPDYGFGFIL